MMTGYSRYLNSTLSTLFRPELAEPTILQSSRCIFLSPSFQFSGMCTVPLGFKVTLRLYIVTKRSAASLVAAEGKCPTITATCDICPTCCVSDCTVTETITNHYDCPERIATSMTYFPCCGHRCPQGCATTSYSVVRTDGPTPTDPCPTVMATHGHCKTCVRPLCVEIETLSFRNDCPWPVPTSTTSYGCNDPCPTGCASTSYSTVTASFGCAFLPQERIF